MFHMVLEEVAKRFSFVLVGAYLPLIVSSDGRRNKAGPTSGGLRTQSPTEVLLFFQAMYFVELLQIKKKLTSSVRQKRGSSIALFVHFFMKAQTAVKEQRGSGS